MCECQCQLISVKSVLVSVTQLSFFLWNFSKLKHDITAFCTFGRMTA